MLTLPHNRILVLVVLFCAVSSWGYCDGITCACSSDNLPTTYASGKMIVGSGNVYAISFYGNRYTSVDRVHQLALIAAAEACEGYPRFFVDNFEFPEGKNAEIMTAECLLPPDEHEDYYSYRSKMWRRGSEVKPYLEARTRVIAEDRALLAECEENQEKTGWAMLGAIGAALAIGLIVLAISGP